MLPSDWAKYKNFPRDSKVDNWGNPDMIDEFLVMNLQVLRDYIGMPSYVNRGYDLKCSKDSQHQYGIAADCSCSTMSLFDFYTAASRFPAFRGIGVCPDWNTPGLHLDVRLLTSINSPRALWGWQNGRQVPLAHHLFSLHKGFW